MAGSLAGALEAVAARLGLSLGEILINPLNPLRSAGVESTVPDRDWSLHFSTCTGFRFSWEVPFIDPLSAGRYRVCSPSRGTVIGEADSAEEAIALTIGGMPAACGPAVAGTADDQRNG